MSYFSTLSRDCIDHLRRFAFDFKFEQGLSIPVWGVSDLVFHINGDLIVIFDEEMHFYSHRDGSLIRKIGIGALAGVCTVDENGDIYVSKPDCIKVYASDGSFKRLLHVTHSVGLAVIEHNLYVSTSNGLTIVNKTTGDTVRQIDIYNYATRTLASTTIQIVVWRNFKLAIFNNDGTIERQFGDFYDLSAKIAIVDDEIHVVDHVNYYVFSTRGQLYGRVQHNFKAPRSVSVSATLLAFVDRHGIHLFPRYKHPDWLTLTNPDNYAAGGIQFFPDEIKFRPRDCLSRTDHRNYTASCALPHL